MKNCQPCKAAGTPKACPKMAYHYLFNIAPIGAEFVLQIALGVLLWTA
ncbi:hypothetical protein [Pseudomonas sp. BF-R-24]|nr:hypothetical protein [Pseudomonas sp. BF-R-24]